MDSVVLHFKSIIGIYDFAYVWNLKNKINKAETNS